MLTDAAARRAVILWPEKQEFEPGGGMPGAARRSPHTALMSQAREPDRTSRVQKAMVATWLDVSKIFQNETAVSASKARDDPANRAVNTLDKAGPPPTGSASWWSVVERCCLELGVRVDAGMARWQAADSW